MKFWSELGYKKIKEVYMEFAAKKHMMFVMSIDFQKDKKINSTPQFVGCLFYRNQMVWFLNKE